MTNAELAAKGRIAGLMLARDYPGSPDDRLLSMLNGWLSAESGEWARDPKQRATFKRAARKAYRSAEVNS